MITNTSRLHSGAQARLAWQNLIDELARHGVLASPGASALLDTGSALARHPTSPGSDEPR